jgi:hypothetical protein
MCMSHETWCRLKTLKQNPEDSFEDVVKMGLELLEKERKKGN